MSKPQQKYVLRLYMLVPLDTSQFIHKNIIYNSRRQKHAKYTRFIS